MEQFKLIAIEPLEGCESHILKNLKIGKKYYFYQGYDIADDDAIIINNEIVLPHNFFTESTPNISVNAIVGKNGSGKSALIELLMRAINNLSFIYFGSERGLQGGCIPVKGISVNLYFKTDTAISKTHIPSIDSLDHIDATYQVLPGGEEEPIDVKNQSFLEHFFYTIIVNYSLYAYNINDYSNEWITWGKGNMESFMQPDRCWIDGVCHKNDGYAMPLVINPMRIKGNIDVNTEKHLTKSRLLTLLVNLDDQQDNNLKTFNREKEIKSIGFFQKEESLVVPENTPEWARNISNYLRKHIPQELYNALFGVKTKMGLLEATCSDIIEVWNDEEGLNIQDITFESVNSNIEYNYLAYKTMSVINQYCNIICPKAYANYYFTEDGRLAKLTDKERKEEITNHVKAIKEDNSHIAIKIKQTINYIKHTKSTYSHQNKYTVNEFSEVLNKMKEHWGSDSTSLIYFMPPSFFNTDITCINVGSTEEYSFASLSSGEKQYIYSTTTILYHIRNIMSAHYSKNDRVKYKYINLILEEIELYYHPEMQRRMSSDLIHSIQDMKFTELKGINICLITHSPIILSDVPSQNILFLDNGEPITVKELTFGANIHSLYKHSFFMDLPMGEFAKNKIEGLFDRLRDNKELSEEQLSDIKSEIQLIGEPLLRNQLMKLYFDKCNIEERISVLEKELKELKQSKNYD